MASSHSEVNTSATATVIITGSATLSPGVSVVTFQCDDSGSALFEVQGEISANAASAVTISASTCGSGHEVLGTVAATAFASIASGPPRAQYAVPMRLRLGNHRVSLCFTHQDGSHSGSYVCSQEFDLQATCPTADSDGGQDLPEGPTGTPGSAPLEHERSCRGVAAFGELTGNPSLCVGGGAVHIAVQVRGAFGEAPSLTIAGPGGYQHHSQLRHSGTSCNYQYNWDTQGNGGAGEYQFQVQGAGRTHSFGATLHCP
jgi:hypothetical protein